MELIRQYWWLLVIGLGVALGLAWRRFRDGPPRQPPR